MSVYEELTNNLLAYTHHFEQEALLGSTPGSCCITPLFFYVLLHFLSLYNTASMYSALPKDYRECTVSEIGGIRLLVLKFCKDF